MMYLATVSLPGLSLTLESLYTALSTRDNQSCFTKTSSIIRSASSITLQNENLKVIEVDINQTNDLPRQDLSPHVTFRNKICEQP